MSDEYDPRSDRELLQSIERLARENKERLNEIMATDTEVLTAVNTLKTDVTAKLEVIQTELTKLVSEAPNPEVLDQALTAVNEIDSAVQAFTVPTS